MPLARMAQNRFYPDASFVRSAKRSPNITAWRAARHIAASTAGIMCIRPLARSSTNRPLRSRLGSMPCTSCLRPDAESRQSRSNARRASPTKRRGACSSRFAPCSTMRNPQRSGQKQPRCRNGRDVFRRSAQGVVGRPLAETSKTRKRPSWHGGTQGRVRAVVAADVKGSTLLGLVKEHILPKSTVFTDDFCSYDAMDRHINEYNHRRINHSEKIYVMGDVHTNTIEDSGRRENRHPWRVSLGWPHYLQTYLNEYSFRYNRRFDEQPMFASFLQQIEKRDTVVRTAIQ